jgi:hypothetical protein
MPDASLEERVRKALGFFHVRRGHGIPDWGSSAISVLR